MSERIHYKCYYFERDKETKKHIGREWIIYDDCEGEPVVASTYNLKSAIDTVKEIEEDAST